METSGNLGHFGTAGLCFRWVLLCPLHTKHLLLPYTPLPLTQLYNFLPCSSHTYILFLSPSSINPTCFLPPLQSPPLPPATLLSLTFPTRQPPFPPSLGGAHGPASTARSSTHLTSPSATPATFHEHTSTALSLACVTPLTKQCESYSTSHHDHSFVLWFSLNPGALSITHENAFPL